MVNLWPEIVDKRKQGSRLPIVSQGHAVTACANSPYCVNAPGCLHTMDSNSYQPVEPGQALQPPLDDSNIENEPPQQDDQLGEPPLAEKWARTVHPRGRQARDPLGVQIRFDCNNIETLTSSLREYIAAPSAPAEHATVEFHFPTSAAFMVFGGDFQGSKEAFKAKPIHYPTLSRSAISVIDALSQADPKEAMRKQKSIAKAVIDAIQNVDGFRYSFHNNWISKEDEACRFSYYCNDSTLNKGRAANEGAGMEGKRKVKPVYDCNGVIHVKFSVTKQSLEILYKHIPIHKTYEERAPIPRNGSKRRRFYELFAPDKLPKPGEKKQKEPKPPKLPKDPRPRKKRRATETLPGEGEDAVIVNGDDSLAPLMDFLGSAERAGEQTPQTNGQGQNGTSEQLIFPAEKLKTLKQPKPRAPKPPKAPKEQRRASSTPRQGRARPSNIPGTMAGYLGDELEIQWTYEKDKPAQDHPNPTEPLQGIAAAAAEVAEQAAEEPKSEMELLKQKLLEAEQRIQRLEAEKSRPMGPPGWPPPAPPGYGYPYPGYGYHQQGPPSQYQPPQPHYPYPQPQQQPQGARQPPGHNVLPHHVDQRASRNTQARPTELRPKANA